LISEHFSFQPHALVNFVGGGGKTALIHKLMEEYCLQGPVFYTTTTRIHPPKPAEGFVVISCDQVSLLQTMLENVVQDSQERCYKIVAAGHFMAPDLLKGVPADFAAGLNRRCFPVILNEADGAASYSIKLPRKNEPALMEGAEYLVPVIGMDCLGQPLGPESVFRFQALADNFSLKAGEPITSEIAANILMHKNGVCKGWKPGVAIVPFINKADAPEQDSVAQELAKHILHNGNFPVEKVISGSVLQGRFQSICD
jgi:probable selenium-dependent hydroxylase accessory protein YqeC